MVVIVLGSQTRSASWTAWAWKWQHAARNNVLLRSIACQASLMHLQGLLLYLTIFGYKAKHSRSCCVCVPSIVAKAPPDRGREHRQQDNHRHKNLQRWKLLELIGCVAPHPAAHAARARLQKQCQESSAIEPPKIQHKQELLPN